MLIGISGRKQAGKNTVCNYLLGEYLTHKGVIEEFTLDTENSMLMLDNKYAESLETFPGKIYSFAEQLKLICVNNFNIEPEKIFGTDAEKDQLTHINWEDMPLYSNKDVTGKKYKKYEDKSGPMSGREFMQIFGSEICRKIWGPIWIESCMNVIKSDGLELALISDVRFPNEVKRIEDEGGIVVRLTRDPLQDSHHSETALDGYDFKYVLDNKNMDIPTQNYEIYQLLKEILFK